MQYASIGTLAVALFLAASPAAGADLPEAPPPPLSKSGLPDGLAKALTSESQRPMVMTRASDIPPYISMLLSRLVGDFADADQPYGASVVPDVGEEKPPTERLVWAARVDDYFIVNWEANGSYTGANTHAFRMQPNGKARFVWFARLNRLAKPGGELNPYRTFASFTEALEDGEITGSSGRCFNLMLATPTAVNVLLRRRTGPAVTDLAALPAPVQETVRFAQGAKIKWAAPVGDYYVVDTPKDSGEVVALIRNPPSTANKPVWKGPTPSFARFEDFQEALRNSMSPESEAEIRTGQCSASTRPAQTRQSQ